MHLHTEIKSNPKWSKIIGQQQPEEKKIEKEQQKKTFPKHIAYTSSQCFVCTFPWMFFFVCFLCHVCLCAQFVSPLNKNSSHWIDLLALLRCQRTNIRDVLFNVYCASETTITNFFFTRFFFFLSSILSLPLILCSFLSLPNVISIPANLRVKLFQWKLPAYDNIMAMCAKCSKIIFGTYRRDARKQKNFRPSAHSATEAELKKKQAEFSGNLSIGSHIIFHPYEIRYGRIFHACSSNVIFRPMSNSCWIATFFFMHACGCYKVRKNK